MIKNGRSFATASVVLGAVVGAPARGQTCEARWSEDLWASAPPGSEMRALKVLDDGSGPLLYMATAGLDNAVARWRDSRLELLGGVTGTMTQSSPTGVYGLAMFDGGSGPALHIGGTFTAVDGVPAWGAAKWTGAAWAPLGAGTDRGIRAILVHDDGTGPALYAAGFFLSAGDVEASSVARWNGVQWSALGSGLGGGVTSPAPVVAYPGAYALAAFDDGGGEALYAGGVFEHAGGSPAKAIARWRNGAWEPVGNGLLWNGSEPALVVSLKVFDAGSGPSLYIGGRVNFGALNPNPLVVRWNGVSMQPVGEWLPGYYVSSFAEADYGGTTALHASIYPYGAPATESSIFRLEGDAWVPIGETGTQPVRNLAAYNDGSGNRLLAGGAFGAVNGVAAPRLARWDSAQWSQLPSGGSLESIARLRVLDLGAGPALYALGSSSIAGKNVRGMGRFDGETWSAVASNDVGGATDAEVFDPGTGPTLFTGGSNGVQRLVGGAWQSVPSGPMQVHALQTFDDGNGARLYAGGLFDGGVWAWNGAAWTTPGGGIPGVNAGYVVSDLEVLSGGAEAGLYAAWGPHVSRWSGSAWEQAQPMPSALSMRLAVHDDGRSAALYAAGKQVSTGVPGYIAKLANGTWEHLPGNMPANLNDIAGFDDGHGAAIYVAGTFAQFAGVPARGLVRWRAGEWSAVGGGVNGQALTLAAFGLPSRSLWVGGSFHAAGGLSSANIARWVGCPCEPDCDGSGALTAADFACFQSRFVAGEPYADCTQDGALTIADFACFQAEFVAGCP